MKSNHFRKSAPASLVERAPQRPWALLLLVACSRTVWTETWNEEADTPQARPAEERNKADAGAVATDVGVVAQLEWLLGLLNERGGNSSEAELRQRFHESFLERIPPEDLQPLLQSAATLAPLQVERQQLGPAGLRLLAFALSPQGQFEIRIVVDASTRQIVELTVSSALELEAGRPTSWEEAEAAVRRLAPQAQYLVANVGTQGCEPLRELEAATPLAMGSAFKLYVLAEAARQIGAGQLSWETSITVRDALKSLPSGQLQTAPEGTPVSVLELAEAMIALSDNTATDHLLDRLGRERVESVLAAAGHTAAGLNIPLLSTRELFLFKLSLSEAEQDAYLAGNTSSRRTFLERLAGRTPQLADAADWTAPRRIAEVEWFASPNDLCSVMAYLLRLSEQPGLEPLLEILALNPGLPIDEAAYPYIGFKGGSEPGVLNTTWLVRNRKDQWQFVSLTANDAAEPVQEPLAFVAALGIFDLLASEE